jgi:hypothetical protein
MVLLLITGALVITGQLVAVAVALWYLSRNARRVWKFTARMAAGILICASTLPLLAFLLSRNTMCGRYDFPAISSPDGKVAAEVSEEDCGAVDSFHSSVSLWQPREDFLVRVFGKRANSAKIFKLGHDPRLIDLSWKDDRTLLIRYPSDYGKLAEFRCQSQWEGIRIECVGYTPDYSKPLGKMPPAQRGLW